MNAQLKLWTDNPLETPKPANDNYATWEQFHQDNPDVYHLIKHYTYEVIRTGKKRYAISAIIERVRWHTEIETKGDGYKINNNWRPFYARLFMAEHPQYEGFFETRTHRKGVK